MEIEAKFRIVQPEHFAIILALKHLGEYTLEHQLPGEQQVNIYYDTPDQRLRAQQYGLRVRQIGERRILAFKGPAHVVDGNRFERAEWEWELQTEQFHPMTWPDSEARIQALELVGESPLQPLLTIETYRQYMIARYDGQERAEFALDEGTFQAGSQKIPFRELEIELRPDGTHADFDALIAALSQHLPLIAEGRSKLAQGLALLQDGDRKGTYE
ncbi:MAG: CYTH domain-containing protein [Chloroflexaceae bacterium]|nr:CYTH domain-containing protein [Chloroflexaceae bacterium]